MTPTSSPTLDLSASIRGRTALVTGGSRGIGRACAEGLLAHGANVAVTYNRGCDEAREWLAGWPARASAHFLDLRELASIERCISEVEQRWGPIEILVNNAAVGSATVAHYEADAGARDAALFDINAKGMFWVCTSVMRRMQSGAAGAPRKVINIASVGGLQVFPSMRLADNISKAAVVYMSRQLAAEHTHAQVDIFALCPGATDTRMLRESTLDRLPPAELDAFVARLPRGRLIEAREVADILVFLASAYSTPLHGAVLDCSMGLGVHPGLISGHA